MNDTNPKPMELGEYQSTANLGIFVCWCYEASVIQILRRELGHRFNSPRKVWYGFLAGFLTILVQEGIGRGQTLAEPKYHSGYAALFLVVYCLAGGIQQHLQRRRLRQGLPIHSYSSGWPVLGDLFMRASLRTLKLLEVGLLLGLAGLCEAARIPCSLWLLCAAVSLVVRNRIDEYAQQLAEADAHDAAIDAEALSRTLRQRRHGVTGGF